MFVSGIGYRIFLLPEESLLIQYFFLERKEAKADKWKERKEKKL